MNVSVHYDETGVKQISVTGEFENREMVDSLIFAMKDSEEVIIHITFMDASIIPKVIVEKLYEFEKRKKTKVFVLKSYLYSYLYKLGINCIYVHKKSIYHRYKSYEDANKVIELDQQEVVRFLFEIYQYYSYDYTKYQMDSILRRIKMSMMKENLRDFEEFRKLVLKDEKVFEQLLLDFSINTTEFFRDPEVFFELKTSILASLNHLKHIKIWCSGCSTGQEPYSLAILLDELGMLHKSQIYATDINPYVVEEAKNGLFSFAGIEHSIRNYRQISNHKSFLDHFQFHGEYMEIHERLKKNILFFQHSLGGDGILNQFQLILCRNVLIYFDIELQKRVLANFYHSLDWKGFLVLGKSESILQNGGNQYFQNWHQEKRIFRGK